MASYLIPKAARNVKLQLFRGLGMAEALMVLFGIVVIVLVFNTMWHIYVKLGVATILGLVVLFMVSPSFIANKKGYQSFEVIFNYWASPKYFKKKNYKKKLF